MEVEMKCLLMMNNLMKNLEFFSEWKFFSKVEFLFWIFLFSVLMSCDLQMWREGEENLFQKTYLAFFIIDFCVIKKQKYISFMLSVVWIMKSKCSVMSSDHTSGNDRSLGFLCECLKLSPESRICNLNLEKWNLPFSYVIFIILRCCWSTKFKLITAKEHN